MKDVPLDVVELPGNRLLCTGTKKMDRASGKHVRQVEVRLPAMQLDPVATLSIVCKAGVGTTFGVYSVKFNHVNNHNETQLAVHAANLQIDQPSDEDFFCSYIVVGKRFDGK